VKIDRTAPRFDRGCPTSMLLGESVTFVPSDSGGSGLVSNATSTYRADRVNAQSFSFTASDVAGNSTTISCSFTVSYRWNGFFQPIDNVAVNKAKSGSTIPVKFSLGGDKGLAILAEAPGTSAQACGLGTASDDVEEYTTATSGLKYDVTADQYIYNWKTDTKWAGTCRQLIVKLADGSTHKASFNFTR
jgi:hypothetical protein